MLFIKLGNETALSLTEHKTKKIYMIPPSFSPLALYCLLFHFETEIAMSLSILVLKSFLAVSNILPRTKGSLSFSTHSEYKELRYLKHSHIALYILGFLLVFDLFQKLYQPYFLLLYLLLNQR